MSSAYEKNPKTTNHLWGTTWFRFIQTIWWSATILVHTFMFEEQSEQFANVPLSWLPPLHFPPLLYVPHSIPAKNLPPSTHINNLEDQIKFTLHYENLINQLEACDNEPPTCWIYKWQQLELKELSSVEILANQLQKIIAKQQVQGDVVGNRHTKITMGKKLKHFLSLPALKSQMSGSVIK